MCGAHSSIFHYKAQTVSNNLYAPSPNETVRVCQQMHIFTLDLTVYLTRDWRSTPRSTMLTRATQISRNSVVAGVARIGRYALVCCRAYTDITIDIHGWRATV